MKFSSQTPLSQGEPSVPSYTTRTTCRLCGSAKLVDLFSLGEQYVSDFVAADKVRAGVKCPIDLILCEECTLVQLRHTARSDLLYRRHYHYRSGVTQTMRDALRDVAAAAEERAGLKAGDVVLDIGSNDGTLLRSYRVPGLVKVGVEPATNLATKENYQRMLLENDFWSAEAFLRIRDRHAVMGGGLIDQPKIITALGMLYDLEDPNAFVADVKKALAPDGIFITQLMCLRQTVDQSDVGNLCHEHLEFYSLESLVDLLCRNSLEVEDIEENSVNGGSYRLYIRHANGIVCPKMVDLVLKEQRDGFRKPEFYRDWFTNSENKRNKCMRFIYEAVAAGKKVWVYGASTKGNTILQWYGLYGLGMLPAGVPPTGACYPFITAAADRDPAKWGKYTIGTGIPIVSEEEFRRAKPDYALVLPYAFLPEMIEREKEWLAGGGKFLVPLPEFKVVS